MIQEICVKYNSTHLIKGAAVFFFVCMAIIATLLVREYWYFHARADELVQIKEEYSNCIAAFKRLLHDEEHSADQEPDAFGEKKKLNKITTASFVVVNRDSEYTKKEAVAFARVHGLDQAVLQMYAADNQAPSAGHATRRRIRRSKRRKGVFDAHQQTGRWEHLKKEPIFAWPIDKKSFYISSPFGPRKYRGVWGFHTGMDMAAVRGTPVGAAKDGVVAEAGYFGGYGNTVVIVHDKKFKTRYAHLATVHVKKGQWVATGELIGKVGDTGNVRKKGKDASHLHFEVYLYGKHVNPFYYLM